MPLPRHLPWRRDSQRISSGKPDAVQTAWGAVGCTRLPRPYSKPHRKGALTAHTHAPMLKPIEMR